MKSEIAKKWVEALRSGQYGQGKENLKVDNNFCCLGVLCDLAKEQGMGFWADDEDEPSAFVENVSNGDRQTNDTLLPDFVKDWAGMKSDDGQIEIINEFGEKQSNSLAGLNDSGMTFAGIAALIETNVDKL
jgi:hypothetical protein